MALEPVVETGALNFQRERRPYRSLSELLFPTHRHPADLTRLFSSGQKRQIYEWQSILRLPGQPERRRDAARLQLGAGLVSHLLRALGRQGSLVRAVRLSV
jgi:hypothetical protein